MKYLFWVLFITGNVNTDSILVPSYQNSSNSLTQTSVRSSDRIYTCARTRTVTRISDLKLNHERDIQGDLRNSRDIKKATDKNRNLIINVMLYTITVNVQRILKSGRQK